MQSQHWVSSWIAWSVKMHVTSLISQSCELENKQTNWWFTIYLILICQKGTIKAKTMLLQKGDLEEHSSAVPKQF